MAGAEPAPWYVDFCEEDCDREECIDAGECAFQLLDILTFASTMPVRRIETVRVAGDLL